MSEITSALPPAPPSPSPMPEPRIEPQSLHREVKDGVVRHIRAIALAVWVIAAVLFAAALKLGASFLVPVVSGIFLSYALEPAVQWLSKQVGRITAAIVVVTHVAVCVTALLYLLWGQAIKMVEQLPLVVPILKTELLRNAANEKSIAKKVEEAADSVATAFTETGAPARRNTTSATKPSNTTQHIQASTILLAGGLTLTTVVGTLTTAAILALFILISGEQFRHKAHEIFGRSKKGSRIAKSAFLEIDRSVSSYLATLLGTNVALGVATWLVLLAFGLEDALIWGVLAALFHLIPYVGPLLTAAGVFLSGILQWQSLPWAAAASMATVVLAFAVGMVLQTWWMGKQSSINPSAMFIGVLFFGWAWGAAGLLLAVPLLVIIRVVAERTPATQSLANLLRDD